MDCDIDTSRTNEYYSLRDDVWLEAHPAEYGMLCIGCVESRLGRRLTGFDFIEAPINGGYFQRSDRFLDRLASLF